jgi:hypothetical protein
MFTGFETTYLYEAERPRTAAEHRAIDRATGELFARLRPEARKHHTHVALPIIRTLRML